MATDTRRRHALAVRRNNRRLIEAARPWRARAGFSLFSVGALVLATMGGIGFSLALWEARSGYLDPSVVRPLPDRRFTANIRDPAYTNPYADMVIDDQRGELVLARADGTTHRIGLRDRLISEGSLRADGALTGPVTALSAACGVTGGLVPGQRGTCAHHDTIFALSASGGLAARAGTTWHTLIGDSRWIGLDDQPVAEADIVGLSLARSGRWLLMNAGAKGIGVFDTVSARWIPIPARIQRALIRNDGRALMVANGDAFRVAGNEGVTELRINDAGQIEDQRIDGISGSVRSMSRAPDGDVLLIWDQPCPGGLCQHLSSLNPLGTVTPLLSESEFHPELSLQSLTHAVEQGGQVVATGQAGVFAYAPETRAWTRLASGAVSAQWTAPDGTLTAAIGRQVLTIRDARVETRRTLPGSPIMAIAPGDGAKLYGLTQDQQIVSLDTGEIQLGSTSPAMSPTEASQVAAVDDLLLMLGPEGALFHNLATREFAAIQRKFLPRILRREDVRIYAAGGRFWVLDKQAGTVRMLVHEIDGSNASIAATRPMVLPAPLNDITAAPDGLRVLAGDGRLLRLTPDGDVILADTLIGQAATGDIQPTTIARNATGLSVGFGNRLWHYDATARFWAPHATSALSGERIAALAGGAEVPPGREVVLDGAGLLTALDGRNGKVLLGGGLISPLNAHDVTDVLSDGERIYLGGAGQVMRYDTRKRQIDGVWRGGTGDVAIAGAVGETPVWHTGGRLFQGERLLSPTDIEIERVWIGEQWLGALGRGVNGPLVLRAPLRGGRGIGPVECLFAQPAPNAASLIDARPLPDGRIAVQTEAGLALYDPDLRRWVETSDNVPVRGDSVRLYRLGTLLVRTRPGQLDILTSAMPTDSCWTGAHRIAWQSHDAVSIAVNETAGTLVLLTPGGSVRRLDTRHGRPQLLTVLPASTSGPDPRDLARVYHAHGKLAFSGSREVWYYDLLDRSWSSIATGTPDAAPADLVALDDGSWALTTGQDRSTRGGIHVPGGSDPNLTTPPAPRLTRFPFDPATVLDVASLSPGRWAVLLDDTLAVLETDSGDWITRIDLGAPRRDRRLSRWDGTLVVTEGPEDTPERRWLLPENLQTGDADLRDIAHTYLPKDDQQAAWSASTRTLYRLTRTGALLKCQLPERVDPGQSCKTLSAPPLTIDRDDILDSWRPDGQTLVLRTSEGWFRLDETGRTLDPVDLPASFPGAPDRTFILHQRLHLWTHGGSLVRLNAEGGAEILGRQVDQIGIDRLGRVWIAEGPAVRRLTPNTPTNGTDFAPQGIDADGTPYRVTPDGGIERMIGTGQMTGLTLPNPDDVTALAPLTWRDPDGTSSLAVFVQNRAGKVRLYTNGTCTNGQSEPCPAKTIDLDAPVKDGRVATLRQAKRTGARIILGFDSSIVEIDTAGTVISTQTHNAPLWTPPRAAPDARHIVDKAIVNVGGEPLLYPSRIEGQAGRLALIAGRRTTTVPGALAQAPLPPGDLGWLTWDRASGTFLIGNDADRKSFPPTRLIDREKFAWSLPGIWIRTGADRWVLANERGYWTVADDARVTGATPMALPRPTGRAHGQFLFAGDLAAQPGQTPAAMRARPPVRIGALTLTERPGGGVDAQAMVSGAPMNAWSDRGFAFDRRIGVGWSAGRLKLVSPFGVLEPGQLDTITALPEGGIDRTASLGDNLHAWRGDQHLTYRDGGWHPTPDPAGDWIMVARDGMDWRAGGYKRQIASISGAPDGLAFAHDRLRDAAGSGDVSVVLTDTGLGGPMATDTLEAPGAARWGPGAVTSLVQGRDGSGQSAVWARTDQGWTTLTSDGWKSALSPDRDVLAHDGPLLRIEANAGVWQFAAKVRNRRGNTRAVAFGWRSGELLPFDRVSSLATNGAEILAGTDFGIQTFQRTDGQVTTGTLIDPRVDDEGRPPAIIAIGRPEIDPEQLLAHSDKDCFALKGAIGTTCPTGVAQSGNVLFEDSLWRWSDGAESIAGTYLDELGQPLGPPVRLAAGRWPHDRLSRSVDCGPVTADAWDDGRTLHVRQNGVSRLLTMPHPGALLCLERARIVDGDRTLSSGIYLAGERISRLDHRWVEIGTAADTALTATLGAPVHRGDIRLAMTDDVLEFHLRAAQGHWRPMRWRDGRYDMDRTTGLTRRDGRLWRMSPLGLMPMHLSAKGKLAIDPDALGLIGSVDPDVLSGCQVDRLATVSGPAAETTFLRCRDRQVLQSPGGPTSADRAFRAAAIDPFVETVLVDEPGFWTWTRVDDRAGEQGRLSVTLRGEPIRLAGRFSVDDLRGAVAISRDRMELLSADGWWQTTRATPDLHNTRRWDGSGLSPVQVDGLFATDISPTGTAALCLRAGARRARLDPTGALNRQDRCETVLGSDGFWTYMAGEDGAYAFGLARNGPRITRTLAEGRFSDLTLTGLPVTDDRGGTTLTAPTPAGNLVFTPRDGILGISAGTPAPHPPPTRACPALQHWSPDGTPGMLGTADGIEVTTGSDNTRTRALLLCHGDGRPAANTASFDLTGRQRFDALRRRAENAIPHALIQVRNGRISIHSGTDMLTLPGQVPGRVLRVLADPANARGYVLTPEEIFEVDLDAALSHLFEREREQ